MTRNNKTLTGEKLLKRTGSYWRKPVLTSAIVVYSLALLFTAADALTVNYVMDKLFKDMALFTTLLTISMGLILDFLPGYIPIVYKKLAQYKQSDEGYMATFMRIALIFSIVTWVIVFVTLCVVRALNAHLIMSASIEAYKEMQADSTINLTFGTTQAQVLMLFLDAVNLGSSAAVFVVTASAMKSNQEDIQMKSITISTWVKEQKARLLKEESELRPLVDAKKGDFEAIEDEVERDAGEVAKAQAYAEEEYTRQMLLSILSDPDVVAKFIKLEQQAKKDIAHQDSSGSEVVHDSADVNATQEAGAV